MEIQFDNYDAVVAGSGFAGCTAARLLADRGQKVLVVERRGQIGGNMREGKINKDSPRVHLYGPHIFHTDSERVYKFLSRFTEWIPYRHRVLASIMGKLVPVPFNFTSMENFFDAGACCRLKSKLSALGRPSVYVTELKTSPDPEINRLGEFVFENVFKHYTEKQWGVTIDKVDPSVINRVPVRIGYNDGYFANKYQLMPKEGYNPLFDAMLANPLITVITGCDIGRYIEFADKLRLGGRPYDGTVVYTGAVDALLDYRLGILPYRTTKLKFATVNKEYFQPVAVVNYPNEHAYTRITEYKHLTGESSPLTSLSYEYPCPYDVGGGEPPFYPIVSAESEALYRRYQEFLSRYTNFMLLGRLAEYKYYDMDKCIEKVLQTLDVP